MELTIERTKENAMKNTNGLDAFDLEAIQEGDSVKTLNNMRPKKIQRYTSIKN